MNNPTGPWSLVRHMWARNFQQNPVGTTLGSLLAVAGIGLLLFFGFFVFIALVLVGGLIVLFQMLLGPTRRASSKQGPLSGQAPDWEAVRGAARKSKDNNALEGEFTVVDDKDSRGS